MPATLAIVGGGYIGVELGTAFAKLGAQVTIVEALDRLLPLMDRALGRVVERRLKELGVRVLLRARAQSVTDGGLVVSMETRAPPARPDSPLSAPARVGAGLAPLPEAGDGTDRARRRDHPGRDRTPAQHRRSRARRGRRQARRRAAASWSTLHAAPRGACSRSATSPPGPALAHKAIAEAEVAAATAAGKRASFDPAAIPQIVFCDPEIASVGMTRDEAVTAGAEVESFRFPLSASGRAQTIGPAVAGHAEVVADGEGVVLGIHLAGPRVSELAGEAALAIEMGATLDDLALTIHPHPTFSEALAESAWGALGNPLHALATRRSWTDRVGRRSS